MTFSTETEPTDGAPAKSILPPSSSEQMPLTPTVKWLSKPAKHDYPAAHSYLMLNAGKKTADRIVKKLATRACVTFKAKDVLRASGLPLLPRTDPEVQKQLDRVAAGEALSPCLIIRGRLDIGRHAQIVDGYHRVCASNHLDENIDIPVQIIGL